MAQDKPVARQNDGELENLRGSAEKPPDITVYLTTWIEKGSELRLEQAISKSPKFIGILRCIAKFIDGTPLDSNGNWKDFAGILGFDVLDIQCWENFAKCGVTLEIITRYAKNRKESATISELLKAIHELRREDILLKISDDLNTMFCDIGLVKTSLNCLSDSGIISDEIVRSVELIQGDADPAILESAPTKFQNSVQKPNAIEKRRHFILLTFADDGYDLARKVADRFRTCNPPVGVVILEEQTQYLDADPNCIHRWFHEVDFIIPIITEKYLWKIAPRMEHHHQKPSSIADEQYARIIFILMSQEYLRNACLNRRVRPVMANSVQSMPRRHALLNDPLFYVCTAESDIDKLPGRLIKTT